MFIDWSNLCNFWKKHCQPWNKSLHVFFHIYEPKKNLGFEFIVTPARSIKQQSNLTWYDGITVLHLYMCHGGLPGRVQVFHNFQMKSDGMLTLTFQAWIGGLWSWGTKNEPLCATERTAMKPPCFSSQYLAVCLALNRALWKCVEWMNKWMNETLVRHVLSFSLLAVILGEQTV